MSVGPLITLLMSHVLTSDDKFTLIKFISIIIGFIGVLFIFEIDSLFAIQSSNSIQLISKFLIIIAAVGYMISNMIIR